MHGFYISLPVSVCLLLYTAYRIYRYILRSTRAMAQFIWSVRYSEFLSSPVQSEESLRSLPAELLNEMNQALDFYKQNLQKKESKLQYFQALANHIDMSVLVYTPSGRIEWMNEAAKRLLDNHNLKSIDELKYFHSELPARLYSLKAGDIAVLQAKKEEETIQLALSGMEFVIQGRPLTVASMKNIHSVLDSQETEAWQKLIRVLTHEIMNSITPVTSLSELLEHQIEDFDGNEEERAEIRRMLQTIRRRGDGLIRFVNSYREVSPLPQPLLKIYTSQELLTGVVRLMYREPNDLHLILPPKGQRLMADKD
ncbi:putative two-component sensor histidine kinase domain protein, partial [Bacteroides fragilis str. 3988 T1]